MNHRYLLSAAIGLLTVSSQAQAQVSVQLTAPNAPSQGGVIWSGATWIENGATRTGSFYVSPYTGVVTANGVSKTVVLNCVDFFHEVSVNQVWSANQTALYTGANLSATRFNNLDLYWQAAYLTTKVGDPDANGSRTIAIQAAIWNLFNNVAPNDAPDYAGQQYWIDDAKANYKTVDITKFYVLTDVNKAAAGSAQEFLAYDKNLVTTTPEPATLTLMGTGLAAMAAARRRRKKKSEC